ncbi:MAG: hypothetical protein WKG52_11010 [Variovorax sp.]
MNTISRPYGHNADGDNSAPGERISSSSYSSAQAWRRVSWGAIVAGVVIALVVQLVLSLLGAGIGLSTIDPLRNSSPDAATFGIGAGVWWVASSAVALFAGGWVAAHLAGAPDKTDASLHGLLTWGLATIVAVYLVASAVGAAVSGGASMLGTAATASAGAGGSIADAAKRQLGGADVSVESIKNEAQQRLAQAAGQAPTGAPVATEEQKAAAEAKARQAADATAKRSSQAALAVLLAMVVGAIAATFGGSLAGRKYLVAREVR